MYIDYQYYDHAHDQDQYQDQDPDPDQDQDQDEYHDQINQELLTLQLFQLNRYRRILLKSFIKKCFEISIFQDGE